jgi:gamma-glutamylcyclotransferase (GGCT)/AIG2-like uncharacterized protein YtfP
VPVSETLFVYGSLRSDTGHVWSRWLMRHASRITPATTNGHLYDLGAYPGLRLGGARCSTVAGELVELRVGSFFWRLLDRYEDCTNDDSESRFVRVCAPVMTLTPARRTHEAWLYAYAGDVGHRRPIPAGRYAGPNRPRHKKRRPAR